ncbi:phytase, partial [Arthrospira platensis SPKY1]|nr:phytase [Arthrospira platensis SPKY1]
LARVFGNFSGFKEIEAITVDREHGWIFYSDESYGIRKYHADPDHPDAELELAVIRTPHFAGDVEGLSIYDAGEGRGYLMASDQSANRMHFFRREGTPGNPHVHD